MKHPASSPEEVRIRKAAERAVFRKHGLFKLAEDAKRIGLRELHEAILDTCMKLEDISKGFYK